MKKLFIIILFFFSIALFSKDNNNPIFFLESIIEEVKPVLIIKDNESLNNIMNKYIDFEEVSYWIVGKKLWEKTEIDLKNKFLFELKKLLLRTYSNTVYYYIDADIIFVTPKLNFDYSKHTRIQIDSIMKKNDKTINISYRLINRNNSWFVYDILMEGISILKTLKNQYSDIIKNKGLLYTINKMSEVNS